MIIYSFMSNEDLLKEWLLTKSEMIENEFKRRNITIENLKELYPELFI